MNLCGGLHAAFQSLLVTKRDHGKKESDSTRPFFGADRLDAAQFLHDARALLKNQLVPANLNEIQCWGFKEIRYIPTTFQEEDRVRFVRYLDFLAQLMPNPGLIFLTRNHLEVIDSAFFKVKDTREVKVWLGAFEEFAKQWSSQRNDCFWIDYREVTRPCDKLKELYSFLGAAWDPEAISKIVSKEHSYDGKAENLVNVERRTPPTQNANTREPKRAAKARQRHHRIHDVPGVRKIAIDTWNAAEGIAGGVVLLGSVPATSCELLARTRQKEYRVVSGLPSPNLRKKFPGDPNAENARFRITFPPQDAVTEFELFLIEASGTRRLLAEVLSPEEDPATT